MPTKWDFLISHTGTCNVRFEEVKKQFLACKSRLENERESAYNNEMWYDYHCRRGCTYFTCPYVWYNYHNDPENIIDWEMNIFDGSPKWCHIRTLNIKTKVTDWLKYEQNMRAYVKWQRKELGYWSNELTDAELSRAMIMGAEELRLYTIKASTYRHAWIKSDFYDKISDWYFIHRGFELYKVINEMGEPVSWEEIFDVKELAYTLGAKHLMNKFVTVSDRKDGYASFNGKFNPEDWNKGRTSEHSEEELEAKTTMVDNQMRKSKRINEEQIIDEEPRSSRGRTRKSQKADNNKRMYRNLIRGQEDEYDEYPVSKFDNVFKNTVRNLPNLPASQQIITNWCENVIKKLRSFTEAVSRQTRALHRSNEKHKKSILKLEEWAKGIERWKRTKLWVINK